MTESVSPPRIPSVISIGNSTTTPLGIAGVFTGTGEEVKDYAVITVFARSDQQSATDGLSMQYSSDGTNWDDIDVYTIAANTGKFFTVAPEGRYFRIVYTNGGTAQGAFRLQTIYHYHATKPSSHRINENLDDEHDAELSIAVSQGNQEHDEVDIGRPMKIGGKAASSPPANVAAGDRVNAYFDLAGRQVTKADQPTAADFNAEVQGDAAHDAPASGNPVLAGAQMETMADSAPGTRASTDGDATKLAATDGALFVIPTGAQTWSYHEDSAAALTDASVHAAPGAGLSLYVTSIVFSTGAATAWNIFFEEGASKVLGPWYLEAVAGRGAVIYLATPKKITANTALTVTTSAAIAHSIDVTGFTAPG